MQEQLLQATIAVVSGAVGGAIGLLGVGLGERFANQRARRKARLDLYRRIFKQLAEAQYSARTALWFAEAGSPSNAEAEETLRDAVARGVSALIRLRHVANLGALMLGPKVGEALEALDAEWTSARSERTEFRVADRRLAAVRSALDTIKEAAQPELEG